MNTELTLERRSTWRRTFYKPTCVAFVVMTSCALGTLLLTHKKGNDTRAIAATPVSAVATHEPPTPDLKIDHIIQHGHIIEIQAKVAPGTTVMVNGQRAAVIWEDGEIKHFVGPLPDGVSDIAISVQNDEGGIATQQLSVSLP